PEGFRQVETALPGENEHLEFNLYTAKCRVYFGVQSGCSSSAIKFRTPSACCGLILVNRIPWRVSEAHTTVPEASMRTPKLGNRNDRRTVSPAFMPPVSI